MEYVVQQRPPGQSYNAIDLERERLKVVHADLDKIDPRFRDEFVNVFKTLRIMNERIPHIREMVGKYVGEHNVDDAIKKLKAEADSEISREAARVSLAKLAAQDSQEQGKRRK